MTDQYVVINNFASTQLALALTDVAVTVQVTDGSKFPLPNNLIGQFFILVVEDISANKEIMYCTLRAGNLLTVTRAQEGTVAQNFAVGSRAELRLTAGLFQYLPLDGGTY